MADDDTLGMNGLSGKVDDTGGNTELYGGRKLIRRRRGTKRGYTKSRRGRSGKGKKTRSKSRSRSRERR